MKRVSRKPSMAKTGVILIGLIFLVSMVGSALMSSTRQEQVEVPAEQILSEPLTPEQEALLRNNYRVIISLEYAEEDEGLGIMLGSLVRQFPALPVEGGLVNFVFLEKGLASNTTIMVKARTEESFSEYNESAIIGEVCDGLHSQVRIRYDLCVLRSL